MVLLDSVDSGAAAVLLVPAVRLLPVVPPVPVPHVPQLPPPAPPVLVQVHPGLGGLVVAQVPPEPVLLHLLSLLLPQVVVESEVPVRLQGRRSF